MSTEGVAFLEWSLPETSGPAWLAFIDQQKHYTPICEQIDPELWFANQRTDHGYSDAQLICFSCPLMEYCRDAARESEEEFGTWGGETAKERERWLKKERRHE